MFKIIKDTTKCKVLAVRGTKILLPIFVESCRGQTLPTISDGRGGDGFWYLDGFALLAVTFDIIFVIYSQSII